MQGRHQVCRLPSFPQHMACSANHSKYHDDVDGGYNDSDGGNDGDDGEDGDDEDVDNCTKGKGSGHGSQHGPTGLIVGPNAWLQRKVSAIIIIIIDITSTLSININDTIIIITTIAKIIHDCYGSKELCFAQVHLRPQHRGVHLVTEEILRGVGHPHIHHHSLILIMIMIMIMM